MCKKMCIQIGVFSLLFLFSSLALSGPKVIPTGINYTINASMMENLSVLSGQDVMITLDSGTVLAGKVKSVGAHLVHLEKIKGKEFFDALIRIENIQAIEARFRKYER